jgi:hypothetical protein
MIKFILKFIYRLLIIRVALVDKKESAIYERLNKFAEYELNTNKGPIKFVFKEDRRKKPRGLDRLLFIKNFIVEIEPSDNIEIKQPELKEKIVIVTKLIVFKINYEVLASVLLDTYVNAFFSYFNSKKVF